MPTFSTPQAIEISLELAAGDAHVTTGERADTVVEVAPRDPLRRGDVRAAEQTRVEYADGRLGVRTPRNGLSWTRGGAVDVSVAAPSDSRLDGHTGAGNLRVDGPLAECTFRSGAGTIRLGDTGDVVATTGAGAVRVEHVARKARIKTGNGAAEIGGAAGDVRVTSANGDITIGRATGSLVAKTANGSVRVGEVGGGPVELNTAFGDIEIGIAEDTAAKLDVRTHFGHVDQQLTATGERPAVERTVTVRGRTSYGDITVRRA